MTADAEPKGTGAPHRVSDETTRMDGVAVLRHPEWARRFPDLLQGITRRADPPTETVEPWEGLRRSAGIRSVVRGHQVHGAAVAVLRDLPDSDLIVEDATDAFATSRAGVLLTVSVADCVPIYLMEPEVQAVGLVHAGWRGIAAGIVESVLERMARELAAEPDRLHVYLGPAICGDCYEVGSEVGAALELPMSAPGYLDLRQVITERLLDRGVRPERVGRSELCTVCHNDRLYSYRGGDGAARMHAFLGWPGS